MSERAFDAVDVIIAKRDGGELSDAQIDWVVDAYTRGAVADEQMSALAMAILLRGMSRREIARWTAAMIASGERLDLSAAVPARPSTSTPPAASATRSRCRWRRWSPPAASAVPQLSGRGLGPHRRHAGQARVDPRLAGRAVQRRVRWPSSSDVGAVICAAGDGLAPADRKLYALRDVTGTVEAIPLIASSIMSKKIAEGTGALVLDVKVGSGAFMKDVDARPRAGRDDGRAGHGARRARRSRCSPTCRPRSG